MANNTFLITVETDQYNKTVSGSVFNEHRFKLYGTDIVIDWGDGAQETDTNNTGEYGTSHVYNSAGIYTIRITGNIIGLADRFLAASNVKVRSIIFPDTLQTIGEGCCIFDDDFTQTKIIIPEGVTTIGNSFLRGTNVEEIILPSTLTSIGTEFCKDCTSLKKVTMKSQVVPTASGVAFANCSNYKILVSSRLLNEYISNSRYPSSREYYDIYEESLAGKIYLIGSKLAENLSNQDVSANANEGLKPLANKILDIGGTEYRNLTYEIDWDDNDNEFELRPSQLPVLLLASGEVIDGCILSQDNNYFYQTSVHKYDVNDEEIIYTWQLLENVKQYYKQEVDINQNAHKTIMTLTPLILTYRGGEFSSYNNTPFSFSDALNIDWDDDTISTYNGGILTHTFDDNSIDHTIAIKGDLTALNDNCFLDCVGLISATLSDNITRFGTSCFRNCSKLENINIPNNITSLEQYCFDGCSSLTDISIPGSVTNIEYSCFRGCSSLTSITIPDGITAIGGNCFQSCTNLTNVTLPNTFTTLGQCAFQYCDHLVQINLPNTLTSTATNCFYNCSRLTNITLPNTLTNLAYGTFSGAGLTTISIPSGVTNIGAYCFSNCNGLSEIVIPEATTNIGMRCFYYCRNLHNIIFKGEVPPTIGNYCFDGVTATIIVPSGSLSAYEAALSGKGGNLRIVEDYEIPL